MASITHQIALRFCCGAALVLFCLGSVSAYAQVRQPEQEEGESESRYSDEPIPLEDLPDRPKPLLELGEPFLGTGVLDQGIRLPTGAVWQPAFLAFGNVRTAAQGTSLSGNQLVEAAARFDLFGNLYLTQTERVLIGFRPLDEGGQFTRVTLASNFEDPLLDAALDDEGFQDELNFGVRTLFFEGDFAELFPKLDWDDSEGLDYGIALGRQPLSFQNGMLIAEDAIDALGLTRANLRFSDLVNVRVTGLFAWGDINRPAGVFGNLGDKNALLFGVFTETDTRVRTVEIDAVFVTSDERDRVFGTTGGSGIYLGLGSIRRIGHYSNTFRVVASIPAGEETFFNRQGVLIHEQLGWTPHHTYNWVYVNLYAGLGEFRSAARGPSNGGPLAASGLLYGSPGIGRYVNALGNRADNTIGGSVGYQMFFDHTRKQLILEAGGRFTYSKDDTAIFLGGIPVRDAAAAALRYQMAIGQRSVVTLGGFGSFSFDPDIPEDEEPLHFGARLELAVNL